MLKIFSHFVLITLCVFPIAAQNKTQVLSINREVIKIQKNGARLQVKERDLSDVSAEGAKTKAFYEKNQIRKTSAEIFNEMGKAAVDFFYQNGKLIFAHRKEFDYDKTFGKIIKTKIQKFYFANDKLITLVMSGKSVSPRAPEFSEQAAQITELSHKILDNFKD